jgi:hypothetical protein
MVAQERKVEKKYPDKKKKTFTHKKIDKVGGIYPRHTGAKSGSSA